MAPKTYTRRPFDVQAMQLTPENFDEVAKWCEGTIREEHGKRYLHINAVLKPQKDFHRRAYVGNFVVKSGEYFKVYQQRAFDRSFMDKEEPRSIWTVEDTNRFVRATGTAEEIDRWLNQQPAGLVMTCTVLSPYGDKSSAEMFLMAMLHKAGKI